MLKRIPIFFACDDNFVKYTMVALKSIIENASKEYLYNVHILNTNISKKMKEELMVLGNENFNIEFNNVTSYLNSISDRLPIRDYYSKTTYFRLFIAEMFKDYEKAIYIDSDTVVLGDISELYNYEIGDNLVGACNEQAMVQVNEYGTYAEECVGISRNSFFNAGMLVINCNKFREEKVLDKFIDLLNEYNFVVTQDEDYLNVICKDKIKYLANKWNTMPIKEKSKKSPSLIHYNLTLKPWHYLDIPYAEYFWKYAKESYYYDDIRKEFGNYNTQKIKSDEKTELSLLDLALSEIKKEDNYIKLVKKEQDTVSQFINQEGTVNQNAI